MENNGVTEYVITWDMGEYAGFESYGAARAYQLENRMVGSTIEAV